MYVDINKYVIVDGEELIYGDIYVKDETEALTVSADEYIVGTKMYVVETGEMYIACSSGWYDEDGQSLTE